VSLSGAATVGVGQESTHEIQVGDASSGVGAYTLTVATNNTSAVQIVDATPAGNPSFVQSPILSTDNSTATLEVAYGTSGLSAGTDVTIGTVTLEGQANGSANITLTVSRIDDNTAQQNSYTVTNTPVNTTVRVGPRNPTVIGSKPATDTDGDGKLDDIDGNGVSNIFDVQALFQNLQADPIQNNPDLFNFDGKGGVDIFDVQRLFGSIN
jgi:hypothetical protein